MLLKRYDAEVRSYDERKENIRARRQLAQRGVLVEDQLVTRLETMVAAKREEAARVAQRAAEQARREAIDAHAVVQRIVADTETVATEITRVSVESTALNERKGVVAVLLERWKQESADVQRNLDLLGLSESIGLQLRSMRNELPSVRELRESLDERRHEMNEIQLERSRRDGELLQLLDLDAVAAARLTRSEDPVPEGRRAEVLAAATAALETYRDEYLVKLVEEYERYFDATLVPLYGKEQQLHDVVSDFRQIIDENILWVQSARRVERADAGKLWTSVLWLVQPGHWRSAARDLWRGALTVPIGSTIGLIAILVVTGLRLRIIQRLGEYAETIPRAATDRYGYTLAAAGLTVVLGLVPGPALMALVGWLLELTPDAAPFSVTFGVGMLRGAFLYAAAGLIAQMCRPKGLAEAHFRWRVAGLRAVRWHLRWFTPVVVTAGVLIGTTEHYGVTVHHDALGRAVFVVAMGAACLFVLRLFRPSGSLLHERLARHRAGWANRTRYVWFPAFVMSPIVMVIVALLGYFYTAIQLERSILATLLLIVGLLVVHAMLLRWLIVAQRRIAIEQARRRRASSAADGSVVSTGAEGTTEEDKIDLAAVNLQTRKLLSTLLGFSMLIGVGLVWIDVLPAVGVLDEIELWSEEAQPPVELTPADTVTTADESAPVARPSRVTLADVVTAIFILVITLAVGRNIPGVLEIAVLQRLPFTPGGRYATTTLVRYAIIIVGLVMAFNAIGIGWSKVQFLAAAVTVGLGFGLQEIFANFVSGLIILFERPIRVGDTVTVGTVNGVVARIRMRATTITDWDRKELIIPNKEFVTGQIINWSLSDSILRVRVPVGIAYGSDTALARRLMLEAARANERVLDDPEPQSMFLGFGNSSLDFELRVHISNIDHFIPVRDELHEAVDQAFRDAGVEIPFPQRDLHVRSLPDQLGIRAAAEPDASDGP